MTIHSSDRVVCVKDIPSNIFEEAIFIMKPNMGESEEEREERTKEMILTEAEEIVEEYLSQFPEEEESLVVSKSRKAFPWEWLYIISVIGILAICITMVI